jgi:ABC-type Zn uptake system ZnuABC Zn-binding protein ZnuA
MKMQSKKFFIKLIAGLFAFLIISGCGNYEEPDNDKIKSVSTISIINDLVKQIGRDKVEAVSICGIGVDPHNYQSVPGDSRKIAQADIVFVNGFGLEGWIDKLIEAAGSGKPVVTVTKGITPLSDDAGHGDPDPHCWFDLRLAKIYVENITEALINVDPANKDFFNANKDEFLLQLDSLHQWSLVQINKIPQHHKILITSHDAFRYFGKAYNIRVEGLQGISTESKVQTRDAARIIDLIKSVNLPAVFVETSVNPKLLEQLALETNAKIGGMLFSDSIGAEGEEGDSFISAFQFNVNTIVKGLTGNL